MEMGLGEAVRRLLQVEILRQHGLVKVSESMQAERDLIFAALNTHRLHLGFDCDDDGQPDSVEIFAKSAATACCRLVPIDTSRAAIPATSRRAAPATSRRKKTPVPEEKP
jgi:hypothetical protein